MISAIVLTYRKRWFLGRFLASLEAQSRRPDEIVVVDDASDDGTLDRLRDLPKDYQIVRLPKNVGQAQARNVGIGRSTGDLVLFLDADIEMRDHMVAGLEATLEGDPKASFAYGHYLRRGTLKGQQVALPWNPDRLRKENYISPMSLVRRRDLPVPAFDPDFRQYEDWDLWLTMAERGRRGVLFDSVLFDAYYRSRDVTPAGAGGALWRRALQAKHGLLTPGSPRAERPEGR